MSKKPYRMIVITRKQFIKAAGFSTISSFSEAVGEDVTNVSKIIRGDQKPRIEKLFHWASILKCPIDDLLWLFYETQMRQNVSENGGNDDRLG